MIHIKLYYNNAYRLSDASGVMEFTLISKGSIDKQALDSMDGEYIRH